MARRVVANMLVAALGSALSWHASAAGYSAQAFIDGEVGSDLQGALGINMATGDANLQSNASAIAINDNNETAVTNSHVVQEITTGQFSMPAVAKVGIEGGAFRNAEGIIGINQAAGAANAQANSLVLSFVPVGAVPAADAVLDQTIAGVTPLPTPADEQVREASVGDNTFQGAHGIFQVNQTAGFGNKTGNSITLRMEIP